MKKFLKLSGEKVMLIHHQPFHEKHGLKKTEKELKQEGVLVDEIPPKPEVAEDEVALPYYNDKKGFYYKVEKK